MPGMGDLMTTDDVIKAIKWGEETAEKNINMETQSHSYLGTSDKLIFVRPHLQKLCLSK